MSWLVFSGLLVIATTANLAFQTPSADIFSTAIAAILLETIPGTAGIMVPPPGYLSGVRSLATEFAVTLDVVEPLGMETMVFFTVNGTEVCARVEPSAASAPGQPMRLYANLSHMHLIDPATDQVL